jgi:hypothetical protein
MEADISLIPSNHVDVEFGGYWIGSRIGMAADSAQADQVARVLKDNYNLRIGFIPEKPAHDPVNFFDRLLLGA